MSIKVVFTRSCLTISDGGAVKSVTSEHEDYAKLVGYYREENFTALEDYLRGLNKVVEQEYKQEGFSVVEDIVFVNDEPLPFALSKKIKSLAEQKLPADRFLKFWHKLQENPSSWAVQSLYNFLDRNKLSITEDGDLVGYKVVRNDFTDNYSGQFSNKPGETVKEKRNRVDDDRTKSCSWGRHVGSVAYVNWFGPSNGQPGYRIIEVTVNPRDVVSVPEEGSENKIRVCQYYVTREIPKEEFDKLEPPDYHNYSKEGDLCDDCGYGIDECQCEEGDECPCGACGYPVSECVCSDLDDPCEYCGSSYCNGDCEEEEDYYV